MGRNIAAYTAAGNLYPEYVSVNDHEKGVSVVFRAPPKAGTDGDIQCGEVFEIIMTDKDFARFLADAVKEFPGRISDPNQRKLAF